MPDPSTIRDVVCTACGCLCDDIELTADRVIRSVERACPIGRAWFLADHSDQGRPIVCLDGVADGDLHAAIRRAAAILQGARAPLILGLTRATLEAQRLAVAIADRIGATVDPGGSKISLARWRAIQRVGIVGATLGEVRDRADVVVFWGVDPVTTHPRHLERYSADPVGRFVPEGRRGRTLIVVDRERTATAAVADGFVRVSREGQGGALAALRMLVRGVEPSSVDPELRSLAGVMKSARYGAFFFGESLGEESAIAEALKLVRDLNAVTRFVTLTMGGPGNAVGAEAVLSWQAGAPCAVDFSSGFPRFLPDEATAERRLLSGEADAALIVGDDPAAFLSEGAMARLRSLPTIAIAPFTEDVPWATVAMNADVPGIHSGGTVMRSDGATLPLRRLAVGSFLQDREWLAALHDQLARG